MPRDTTRLKAQLLKQRLDTSIFRSSEPLKKSEFQYFRQLRNLTNRLNALTAELILPKLESEIAFRGMFKDDFDTGLIGAFALFRKRVELMELGEAGVQMVSPALRTQDGFNRKEFIKGMKRTVSVDVSQILSEDLTVRREFLERIDENVKLIKTIPEKYLDSLTSTITAGLSAGDDFSSLRREIIGLGQSTKKRAKFIARDQISKYNNKLNRIRQENVGVKKYRWRTAGDRRVSDEHKAHEGKVFEWAHAPAPDGHPGDRPNCRCAAEPHLEDILELISRQNVA